MVTVQHGHDQAQCLGSAEHERREAQAASSAVAAVWTAHGIDRDPGLAQHSDVTPGRPLGDAEPVCQPVRSDARACLDHLQSEQRPCRRAYIGPQKILPFRK